MTTSRQPFLFSAIVGQEKLRTAYLANLVNPSIGGLLISGPKGTGKSTIVHSVLGLLPTYQAVAECRFNCDPERPDRFCSQCRERSETTGEERAMRIVNLPLSCTEDRLIGTIDVERLLKTGEKRVQVGLLGEAHRNILYVDEVNLLPDHLVDDILDAAASPWNTIEREGISVKHPTDFVLVGTMNPEEGELRPQILDRFAMCAQITTEYDVKRRAEIVRRNLLFEGDPERFYRVFAGRQEEYKGIIGKARRRLGSVSLAEPHLMAIAQACGALKVDGQRPDIVIVKGALAIAALEGREQVTVEDILLAAEFALCHRTRDGGLMEPPTIEEINTAFVKAFADQGAVEIKSGDAKSISGKNVPINQNLDQLVRPGDESVERERADSPSDEASDKKKD